MNNKDLTKEEFAREIDSLLPNKKYPSLARFVLSALGGIPIGGGVIAAIGGAWSEKEQANINSVFKAWLKIQEEDINSITKTLSEVIARVDIQNENIISRVQSKEYLDIIKKCFRDWSASDSEDKRLQLCNLLTNAATTRITDDDVIKLFIEWIDKYTDMHFKIISIIYRNEGITRYQIWDKLYDKEVREDSAEADIFKLIMQDLSIGHVIRQYRATDDEGNYIRHTTRKGKNKSPYLKSAFDKEEPYVLTELGKQFASYTMDELTLNITTKNA